MQTSNSSVIYHKANSWSRQVSPLTMSDRLKSFKEKGYVILRGLLTGPEVARLKESMETGQTIRDNEYGRSDARGMRTRVTLWNNLPDNIAGAIAKAEKVVGAVEEVLEGDIYHYHSKLIMKDPKKGGAFLWHQDYGYWYEYHCLFPTMGTLWIAVDPADRTNSCLQILEGSHRLGRIDTVRQGDQIVADPARVDILKKHLPSRYVELDAGDAVFFHSNLLHTSDQNVSGKRRWAFLVAYNRSNNIPFGEHPHADYEPLIKVPDSAIMKSPLLIPEEDRQKFWTTRDSQVGLATKAEG